MFMLNVTHLNTTNGYDIFTENAQSMKIILI